MRKNIVAGNWKMNLDKEEAISLVKQLLLEINVNTLTQIILAPSYIYISDILGLCMNSQHVSVASQDCSVRDKGAFTGEVAASMLKSIDVEYVIVGHSERRAYFDEDNQLLKKKVIKALSNDLKVIFCCGESLEQRNKQQHFDWIRSQLSESLFSIEELESKMSNIIIAYEPIWAIGSGESATLEEVKEMHAFIRNVLLEVLGRLGANARILYGGSVTAENAADLIKQDHVNGLLVGGASLKADSFSLILNALD